MELRGKIKELHEFAVLRYPNIPQEVLLCGLLYKVAQAVGVIRPKVGTTEIPEGVPINFYGIIFLHSGGGKDKTLRFFNETIMKRYREEWGSRNNAYWNMETERLAGEAEEKFQKSNAQKELYLVTNSPRPLVTELSDGTSEGLTAIREAYEVAGFGTVNVRIPEFADYILIDNPARQSFVSALIDMFDFGDAGAKVLKGEKIARTTEGVPVNALMYTAPSGLLEGRGRERLTMFLSRGMARRSFICYPKEKAFIPQTYEEKLVANKEIAEKTKRFCEYIGHSVYAQEMGTVYQLTPEADRRLFDYEQELLARASRGLSPDEAIRAETANRHWKTLKLAGLFAVVEHPGDHVVTIDDLISAISISETLGGHIERFFDNHELLAPEKLYLWMRHKGTWVSKMEIRAQRFVSDREFSGWFNEALEDLKAIAEREAYHLEGWKEGRTEMFAILPPSKFVSQGGSILDVNEKLDSITAGGV